VLNIPLLPGMIFSLTTQNLPLIKISEPGQGEGLVFLSYSWGPKHPDDLDDAFW